MLKINPKKDIKELEKFGIYPIYECDKRTGKTRIKALCTDEYKYEKLFFKKKTKKIARKTGYELEIDNQTNEIIDLNTLYDLIKADMVVKE